MFLTGQVKNKQAEEGRDGEVQTCKTDTSPGDVDAAVGCGTVGDCLESFASSVGATWAASHT